MQTPTPPSSSEPGSTRRLAFLPLPECNMLLLTDQNYNIKTSPGICRHPPSLTYLNRCLWRELAWSEKVNDESPALPKAASKSLSRTYSTIRHTKRGLMMSYFHDAAFLIQGKQPDDRALIRRKPKDNQEDKRQHTTSWTFTHWSSYWETNEINVCMHTYKYHNKVNV